MSSAKPPLRWIGNGSAQIDAQDLRRPGPDVGAGAVHGDRGDREQPQEQTTLQSDQQGTEAHGEHAREILARYYPAIGVGLAVAIIVVFVGKTLLQKPKEPQPLSDIES